MIFARDKRVFWASLLIFGQQGATIVAASYANASLISIYTPGIFVAYYAVAALTSALTLGISQVLAQKTRRYIHGLYLLLMSSMLVSLVLFYSIGTSVIFATCIVIVVSLDLSEVAGNNSIFLAFDIREMHRNSRILTIMSCASALLFCGVVPILINVLGPPALLLVTIFIYGICLYAALNLKALPYLKPKETATKQSPLSFPIFRLAATYAAFTTASLTLIDYALKRSLRDSFSVEMVGIVSAIFFGVVSLSVILVQVIEKQWLVKRFGALNVLLFAPVVIAVFGAIVLAFPGTPTVLLLYLAQSVYVLGVSYVGTQMLLNAVPRSAQFSARSQMQMLVLIASDALIIPAILSFLGEANATTRVVVASAFVFVLLSFIVMLVVKRKYSQAIKSQVEQPRFAFIQDLVSSRKIENQDLDRIVPQIGHVHKVEDTLVFLRTLVIDPLPFLTLGLNETKDIFNFEARVKVIARLSSPGVDAALGSLLNSQFAILPNALPHAIAMRSLNGLQENLKHQIFEKIKEEKRTIWSMKAALAFNRSEILGPEIYDRLVLATRRFLYYFASVSESPRAVLNTLPRIFEGMFVKTDQIWRADALNYLDVITRNVSRRADLHEVLEGPAGDISESEFETIISRDAWLSKIRTIDNVDLGKSMDITQKALFLSQVQLFRQLPAEMLTLIAESLHEESFSAGAQIFRQGDESDRVYLVVSGEVNLTVNERVQKTLKPFGLFGEVAMLGSNRRTGNASAVSQTTLMSIQKLEFLQMVEDVPEIGKAVIQLLISYLENSARNA